MIFYFTGTGNSLWVAKALSEALGEQLVSIAEELHKERMVGAIRFVRMKRYCLSILCIPGDRRCLLPVLSLV